MTYSVVQHRRGGEVRVIRTGLTQADAAMYVEIFDDNRDGSGYTVQQDQPLFA